MKNAFLIVAIAAALAACGNDTPQYVQQPAPAAQAPVVVQQDSASDMLAGAALGAVAGHMLTRSSHSAPARAPVINKTVIVQKNVTVHKKKVVINKSPSGRSSFMSRSRRK